MFNKWWWSLYIVWSSSCDLSPLVPSPPHSTQMALFKVAPIWLSGFGSSQQSKESSRHSTSVCESPDGAPLCKDPEEKGCHLRTSTRHSCCWTFPWSAETQMRNSEEKAVKCSMKWKLCREVGSLKSSCSYLSADDQLQQGILEPLATWPRQQPPRNRSPLLN